MIDYLIRRLLLAVVTLLLITFVVYGLIRLMPGDPLLVQLSNMGPDGEMRSEDIERMRIIFGLDKPWYIAYFDWLGNTLQGDLGISLSRNVPVYDEIKVRIPPTLLLSVTSLILTYLFSIPMGLYASSRNGKPDERAMSTVLYMLYSLPSFVAALMLQIIFAVNLNILPLSGIVSDNYEDLSFFGKVADLFWHSILPVICYTYGSLAYYSRFVRANLQEVIRQDYIRTAKAKGVGPLAVLFRHAFRNTLIPLVTMIGLTLPALLSGAIILEYIFSWPGMGMLFFESIRERDYPTLMGLMLMFSVLTLLGQLLADILYAVVDPRVSYN